MSQYISYATSSLLFRQLAAASRSNLPYGEVLQILSQDPEMFGRDTVAVQALANQFSNGDALSSALLKLPELVCAETAELVKTAETQGSLAGVLDNIADDLTELEQRRTAIRQVMAWPAIILAIASILIAMMMIFVIPAFSSLFASFGADLPTPTLMIMGISDFVVRWWWLMAALIAALVISVRLNKLPHRIRLFAERAVLGIPLARKYLVQAFASRTVNWLKVVHHDPKLLLAALHHLRATTSVMSFQLCLVNLESRLAGNMPLGQALTDLDPLPKRVALLMQLGEKVKDIDGALDQIADFSEAERLSKLAGLERWFILCIYVFLGTSVGLFVIGMYLPIFKMGQAVG